MFNISDILWAKFGTKMDPKTWTRTKDAINQKCRDASRETKKK
jgi:hypothetical protein